MRWKPHVRFGGRAGEMDLPGCRHRALVRSHWATAALDQVRREVWNEARRAGMEAQAKELKGAAMPCGASPRTSPPARRQSSPTLPR
jgi:hypothetical protein